MVLSELLLEAISIVDTLNEEFNLLNEFVKLNVLYSKMGGIKIVLCKFSPYYQLQETSIIWNEQDDDRDAICLEDGSFEPLLQFMRRKISHYIHYNCIGRK